MATTVDVPAEQTADPPRTVRPRALVIAGIGAALAVLCGLLLPLAPVIVSQPTVHWPREPGCLDSTMLTLTAYRPLALDVRVSCAVARLAGRGDGLIVATTRAGAPGLQVIALGGRMQVRAGDRTVLDEPRPAGDCGYRVSGRSAGRPSFLAGPPSPAGRLDSAVPVGRDPPMPGRFAGPDNAELVVERDGRLRSAVAVEQLPDVDLLRTSLGPLPAELVKG